MQEEQKKLFQDTLSKELDVLREEFAKDSEELGEILTAVATVKATLLLYPKDEVTVRTLEFLVVRLKSRLAMVRYKNEDHAKDVLGKLLAVSLDIFIRALK